MEAANAMPARDAEGYLIEPAEWNEGVARRPVSYTHLTLPTSDLV